MRQPTDTGPEPLNEILSRLFTARGWGRRQGRLHLEKAWAAAAAAGDLAEHTRVLGLRRGILEVEVASSVLLQELAHYRQRQLLNDVQAALPSEKITELRFKVGSWK